MADTAGLLKTRGEYTDAVTNGETDKSHKDWYEEKQKTKPQAQATPQSEAPYNARWRDRPITKEEK